MLSSHSRRRILVLSILALAVGLCWPLAGADRDRTLSIGDAAFQSALYGPVHPSKEVQLTAPLGAIVAGVQVEETQLVKADELLVQMDDAIPRSQVAVRDIEVRYAQAQYDEAETTYFFTKKLYEDGAGGEGEARRAELAMVSRRMAVGVAEEQHNAARVELSQYRIKAPFDGEIGLIKAEKGARLNAGDVALTIVSRDPLEAHLDLPVVLMDKLEVGKAYAFEAFEPVGDRVLAKLKTLDRNINYATKTFRCVFTIENPGLKLPSGFEVKLLWPQP
jgi:membrane fusion protein, multidrug efflux system